MFYYYSKTKESVQFIDVITCDICGSLNILVDEKQCIIYHTSVYRWKKMRQKYVMEQDIDLVFCSAKCSLKNYLKTA